jgi:hypothetical protein
LPLPLERLHPLVDMLKLGIAIGVLLPFNRFAVGLQVVAQVVQEPVNAALTDLIALLVKLRR